MTTSTPQVNAESVYVKLEFNTSNKEHLELIKSGCSALSAVEGSVIGLDATAFDHDGDENDLAYDIQSVSKLIEALESVRLQ